jgi:hypothetical protein
VQKLGALHVSIRKAAEAIARIETRGCPRVNPPYGGTLDRLPASFWARFEESLAGSDVANGLDATEWSLMQAARDIGYHTGQEIIESTGWADFVGPLDEPDVEVGDALHAAFAALTGMGLDDCEIVEMVPHERMVLRVYGYWGLLVPGPNRSRRRASLVTRGICAAVMDLAYGGPYDPYRQQGVGPFSCVQSRSVDHGDLFDEFVTTRL